MWVLVLFYVSAAMTVVPGYYTTKDKCEEAANAIRTESIFLNSKNAICIPAPDYIGYE